MMTVFNLPNQYNTNINWRNVQRKIVVNNVDMSSLRALWQNDPYNKTQQTFREKETLFLSLSDFFSF